MTEADIGTFAPIAMPEVPAAIRRLIRMTGFIGAIAKYRFGSPDELAGLGPFAR